jgi:NADH-quinone oxidoreductase subunit E
MKKEGDGFVLEELSLVMRKNGHITEPDIKNICKNTGVPYSQVYSVATFYSLLDIDKKGRHIIRVCTSPSCHLNGSDSLLSILKKQLKIDVGETTKDSKFTLEKSSCIGCCNEPPAMLIDLVPYTKLNEQKIRQIIKKLK